MATTALELVLRNAEEAPDVTPGSPEWQRRVTASKVPSLLGVDPWGTTPYTAWHVLAGHLEHEEVNTDEVRRGNFLEDGVAQWWHADHPEYVMEECGTFQHRVHGWAYATPDRLLLSPEGRMELLEVKTQARMDGWGGEQHGGVPIYYWLQGLWQCFVTGARRVHFVVLGTFLEREEFVVDYAQFDIDVTVETVADFVDSLPGGAAEREPSIYDPVLDWRTLTSVHVPTCEGVEVADVYAPYVEAKREERAAKKRAEAARAEVIVAAADGKAALFNGAVVAKRSGKSWRFNSVKD